MKALLELSSLSLCDWIHRLIDHAACEKKSQMSSLFPYSISILAALHAKCVDLHWCIWETLSRQAVPRVLQH